MILIAETKEENIMLPGISALLTDLGVEVIPYRTDEAFAVTFWSADELSHIYAEHFNLTHEEAVALLEEIEPFLHATMTSAGARLIDRILQQNRSRVRKWAFSPDGASPNDFTE